MAENTLRICGVDFINKLLAGERDFSEIHLDPYFSLSRHELFPVLQEYLKKADFEHTPVILDRADLTGLDADGVHLPFLKANGACFKHAVFMEANLQSSELRKADFRYARLVQADMNACDLRDADMRQADLNLATVTHSTLSGTNMAGANLLFTNMRRANINGIVNLAQARSVDMANFQFVSLSDKEKVIIRMELWAQGGKKQRLFGGAG